MLRHRTAILLLVCSLLPLPLAACGGGGEEKAEKKKSHKSAKKKSGSRKRNKEEAHDEGEKHAEDDKAHGSDKAHTVKAAHGATAAATAHGEEIAAMPFEEALARLKAGNKRFTSGALRAKDFEGERAELLKSQHPYAIVLACADSRVPPEILFDESLGKLFVIRVAGNIVDPAVLGSVEYAAEHLHTRLLMVLGHESCGAVKATLAGGHFTPNIDSLVSQISAPAKQAKALKLDEKGTLAAAIEGNVVAQMQAAMKRSKLLADLVAKNDFALVGGVYDFDSGSVKFIEDKPAAEMVAQKK